MTEAAGDLAGRRFGRLVVLARAGATKSGAARWRVSCDCGTERVVLAQSLLGGATASCGCLKREQCKVNLRPRTHGQGNPKSRTYVVWDSMIQRCTPNPRRRHYRYYAARGISVCERWRRFENFLSDMGEAPDGLTLDRIDNDGNYEPGNCRWATWSQQANNKSGGTK